MAVHADNVDTLCVIDLHCHLLPGIDDGPKTLETTLEMARIAVADGIETIFCTPHIYPGLYENVGPDIVVERVTISIYHGIASSMPCSILCVGA